MREVERVLKRDVPRYLKGLPIPRDYAAIQSLTLREWLYLLPLLLVVAGLARISFYFILLLIFLMFLINA
ncbi:hypothetical protein Poli38472_004653 [Pythium oligandrum]|uniref:Iron sulphur domain-containing protein n=1 Tax=Pythium oligandrum TaxID=41045 RepID=A0A8K1CAP7_PYTOL|nr:hypothetical protein Poli38472_004653 [Pythium oligandrum]|eukprot:TMW59584.1 hypothetical protein Poli38472_004653 [Pythium oligandrum]